MLGLRHRLGGRQLARQRRGFGGLGCRLGMARHHQQIGAAAQRADVAQHPVGIGLVALGVERPALAVERVHQHRELDQVEHRPVAEPAAHERAVVLHRQLGLGRDAAARAVEVAVAALIAAEGHRLADAGLDQPVGARDQHLDHVELAAQAARGEQPGAAAGAERHPVQVADRAQLARAVEVHLSGQPTCEESAW